MNLQYKPVQRMHKSSSVVSVVNVKANSKLDISKIEFNPAEFHVGESRVERLPVKVITRGKSQPTLPRT
jgi:hypothetical protein